MFLLSPSICLTLLAAATSFKSNTKLSSSGIISGITWLIDGNNLMGHRGTPKTADAVATKLQAIRSDDTVVFVLDGQKDGGQEETMVTKNPENDRFRQVSLGQGISADDYILEQIQNALQAFETENVKAKIQVVTADRLLRRKALEAKPIVRQVINPVTFWKRYLPRLSGLKLPKLSDQQEEL